jgi:hypothetical protein
MFHHLNNPRNKTMWRDRLATVKAKYPHGGGACAKFIKDQYGLDGGIDALELQADRERIDFD